MSRRDVQGPYGYLSGSDMDLLDRLSKIAGTDRDALAGVLIESSLRALRGAQQALDGSSVVATCGRAKRKATARAGGGS
jgi:hypothetical protein